MTSLTPPTSYAAGGAVLDAEHLSVLNLAIRRVLETEAAADTFAQILDGLPTAAAALDRYEHRIYPEHPVHGHTSVGREAVAMTGQFCGALTCVICASRTRCVSAKSERPNQAVGVHWCSSADMPDLKNYKSFESLQRSRPGKRPYDLAILELVAEAVHQIAVHLFQKDLRLHDSSSSSSVVVKGEAVGGGVLTVERITTWRRPARNPGYPPQEPWPTLFAHPMFTAHEQYPAGVADVVGYWAEDRIFGGVILFDRHRRLAEMRDDDDEDDDDRQEGDDKPGGGGGGGGGVYFNSARPGGTYKIFRLSPSQ
ncbi:hypothetical protein Micbo1qcDRAFT_233252 [Microdochium bolleyi]|uniref:Uncharacterized protein n=1 Tax=Microdochium bolleyi TaxID=196109 RepID=A0A136J3W0_9PEZI|nr:hypothetical protein Micbo1qcDRAFT_233252 [Microdochium bolleyi]